MARTIKITEELVEIASEEGRVMRRSIGAQVEYWARLGRRIEASGAITSADVRRLLGASGSVQDLDEPGDEAYLGALTAKLESLDGSDARLLDDLRAGGHAVAFEDASGRVRIEAPGSGVAGGQGADADEDTDDALAHANEAAG
jgi:hypothetical protein